MQKGVSLNEREIFSQPLSRKEIEGLLKLVPMAQLFSSKSQRVKALELNVDSLSDAEKLDLMTKEPALLKRPIIIASGKPVVGFDVKRLEALFE